MQAALGRLPVPESTSAEPSASELVAVLRAADAQANALSDRYISTEHLLLALAADPGAAGDALRRAGANQRLLAALAEVRGSQRVTGQPRGQAAGPLERLAATSPRSPSRASSTR